MLFGLTAPSVRVGGGWESSGVLEPMGSNSALSLAGRAKIVRVCVDVLRGSDASPTEREERC